MTGLGIDGGGSATRWVVSDGRGRILARGEVAAVSGHLFDEAARAAFAAAAGEIAAALPGPVERVVAGITGLAATAPAAAEAAALLAAAFGLGPASVAVHDDLWIAYHAVFRPGEGHVVYSGTGSIGLHIAAGGGIVRVGGRGPLIDDGGSAFAIARAAIGWVWHARDRDPDEDSPLGRALDAAIGGHDWDTHRAYIYGGGRNAVAQLARAVAAADDPVVRRLMGAAAGALAGLARALIERAGPRPVALMGRAVGLHPELLRAFAAAMERHPWRRVTVDAAAAAGRLAAGADAVQAGDENPPPEETT